MYTKENYTHTRSCISEEDRGNTQVQSHLQRERERERERKREKEGERKREKERGGVMETAESSSRNKENNFKQ